MTVTKQYLLQRKNAREQCSDSRQRRKFLSERNELAHQSKTRVAIANDDSVSSSNVAQVVKLTSLLLLTTRGRERDDQHIDRGIRRNVSIYACFIHSDVGSWSRWLFRTNCLVVASNSQRHTMVNKRDRTKSIDTRVCKVKIMRRQRERELKGKLTQRKRERQVRRRKIRRSKRR